MLQIKDLYFSYGNSPAVQGISFEVSPGEIFGLLGPNGAGKTTTLHLIGGVLSPAKGEILLFGSHTPQEKEARKKLGIATQSLALYEELTGEENLFFYGKLYGLSHRTLKERVGWCLAFSGLEERKKDRVKKYSGGMKRRLNLAVAIVHDPDLLLLDEPTVGVDPQSRNRIFDMVLQQRKEGKAILYTTHYMEEAQRLCDRVAIMDHGKVLAMDTVPRLIARHSPQKVVKVEGDLPPSIVEEGGWQKDGEGWVCTTENPETILNKLLQAGIPLPSLQIEGSNLETVFLNLTGRRLRD